MESLELRKPAGASGDTWVTSAGRCQGELGPVFAGVFWEPDAARAALGLGVS